MNVVKLLKKQIENGKDIVMNNGDIISKAEIRKTMLKTYLAGIKVGEIDTAKSFDEWLSENSGEYVSLQEVIDFIEDKEEAADAEPATAE